jgi:hypothetical protein
MNSLRFLAFSIFLVALGTFGGCCTGTSEPPRMDEGEGFFEEFPAWNMPDLAVAELYQMKLRFPQAFGMLKEGEAGGESEGSTCTRRCQRSGKVPRSYGV